MLNSANVFLCVYWMNTNTHSHKHMLARTHARAHTYVGTQKYIYSPPPPDCDATHTHKLYKTLPHQTCVHKLHTHTHSVTHIPTHTKTHAHTHTHSLSHMQHTHSGICNGAVLSVNRMSKSADLSGDELLGTICQLFALLQARESNHLLHISVTSTQMQSDHCNQHVFFRGKYDWIRAVEILAFVPVISLHCS